MMEDEPSDVPSAPIVEATGPGVEAIHRHVEAVADMVIESAEAAQAGVDRASETVSKAADETAKAFEEARGRLQGVGIDRGSDLLDQFKSGSDALSSKLGASYARTSEQMAAFNAKAIEAWRTNAEATITHWQSIAAVKSLSEMISLNAAHTRKQIETMTAQTRELAELAGQLARDAGKSGPRT